MKKNYRLEAAQLVRQTTRGQHGSSLRMSSLSGAIDNRQPPPTGGIYSYENWKPVWSRRVKKQRVLEVAGISETVYPNYATGAETIRPAGPQ